MVPVTPVLSATAGSMSGIEVGARTMTVAVADRGLPLRVCRRAYEAGDHRLRDRWCNPRRDEGRWVGDRAANVRRAVDGDRLAFRVGDRGRERDRVADTSTVVMSATWVTAGAWLARTVTVTLALPSSMSVVGLGRRERQHDRPVAGCGRRGRPRRAQGGCVAERAYVGVGRPCQRRRLGNGV